MQKTERDIRIQRHSLLARWTAQPRPEEASLVALAKVIDPEGWSVRDFFNRRFLSLEAAYRVSIHNAAHEAVNQMALWSDPAPKPLALTSRFAALFRVLPLHRRALSPNAKEGV